MGKRIILFLLTNLAIVLTLSVVLSLLGVGNYITPYGLDLEALAVFSLVWGMGGAFISLQMSRWIAKRATGVRLIDGNSGHADADWVYATVAKLTQQANLPMPEVGASESGEVNACATGPSKSRSLVAVSSGLLRSMRQAEVEGVLAHQVAPIANGDNSFSFSALEMSALLAAKQGDTKRAYDLVQRILGDPTAPAGVRRDCFARSYVACAGLLRPCSRTICASRSRSGAPGRPRSTTGRNAITSAVPRVAAATT